MACWSLKKPPVLGFPQPGSNRCPLLGANCLESRVFFTRMWKTTSPSPRAVLCVAERRETCSLRKAQFRPSLPQLFRFKRFLHLATALPLSLEGKNKTPPAKIHYTGHYISVTEITHFHDTL